MIIAAVVVRVKGWKLQKKIWQTAVILGAAAVCGLLAGISGESEQGVQDEGFHRNEWGKGDYHREMEITVDELLYRHPYVVRIPEQKLTEREEKEFLAAAEKEILEEFSGENASVNEIRHRIFIRDSYQDGRVQAEWSFEPYDIVDVSGEILTKELPEKGEDMRAFVRLECGASENRMEFGFRVLPPQLNETESFLILLEKMMESQAERKGEKSFLLPQNVGGYIVSWRKKGEYLPEKIFLLGCVIAALILYLERSRKQELQKKRAGQLLIEYPEMVSKLTLLLGAGMTVKRAFCRIAFSYREKRKKQQTGLCIVCEEMLITCHEMESGVGEERAYERFGERCGLESYRKLGNILSQNLRKGGTAMTVLLEKEVENAFEERKSAAKRYGEEAGTKLLFPMILMLGMIMAILIVPAVMAFQM